MNIPEIIPVRVGPAPIIRGLIDNLHLAEIIDEHADEAVKKAKLSVGTRIKAIIVQVLTDRKALYRMEEWFSKHDVELLVAPDVTAKDLNDDALSRALDHLYTMDFDTIYSQTSLRGVQLLQDPAAFRSLHADTTSLSFYGNYNQTGSKEELKITYGYSKDHRPDLKQIQFGLVTAEGLPVYGDVHDGNTSDGKWNRDVLPKMKKLFELEAFRDCPLIADSALVTKENLEIIQENGISFLSRLPERYKLAKQLKQKANQQPEKWEVVGKVSENPGASTYRIQSIEEKLDGHRYRFVIVQSSALDKRKEKAIQRALQKEKSILEKAIRQEEKQIYSCQQDAAGALIRWCQAHQGTYQMETETLPEEEIPKRTTRGRPKKDATPPVPVTVYRNRIRLLSPEEEVLEERRYQESTFLLITNMSDHDRFSDSDLLKGYKEQYRVEQRFRFLKSPYFVGPMYIQKPSRVQAFGSVMLLALLVYSFLQQSIRKAMKKEDEPLLLPGKRKSFHPTGLSILELLEDELILHFQTDKGLFRQLPKNKEAQLPRILQLLDLEENLYTQIKNEA